MLEAQHKLIRQYFHPTELHWSPGQERRSFNSSYEENRIKNIDRMRNRYSTIFDNTSNVRYTHSRIASLKVGILSR